MPSPHPTPPPQSPRSHDPAQEVAEEIAAARIRATALARDFETVFGQSRRRSAAQGNVLEHLGKCAGEGANAYRFNEARDGIAVIAAGIHRDGAQSMMRIIDRQLEISSQAEAPKKPTPKIKR